LLYRTITLGCKVNQYETELLGEGLRRLGYRPAGVGEAAQLCAVNTCTVTAESDAKSRKAIRQLARENPGAEIVVMGCYATRAADELARLPGVVDVLTDKRQIPEWLARRGLLDPPRGIGRFGRRHRAYVKVQDGCRMPCAYCIIPRVRPKLSSRPADAVEEEVRGLIDAGYREVVLTGIHLGHYGADGGEQRPGLPELVERLAQLPGEFRLRLSSLEAAEVDDRLLAVMAAYPRRICPHLHLSLQSGSDTVLQRMRRRDTVEQFGVRCEEIRRRLDQPALTTDLIVGFPGESDAEFDETCRLVRRIGFAKVHLFRFSPRQGTAAADMPGQIDGKTKRERMRVLEHSCEHSRRWYLESLVGRRLEVLVEEPLDEHGDHAHEGTREATVSLGVAASGARRWLGTADRYVPVELPGQADLESRLVAVEARGMAQDRLTAEIAR